MADLYNVLIYASSFDIAVLSFLMQSFQVYSHIGKKGDAKDSRWVAHDTFEQLIAGKSDYDETCQRSDKCFWCHSDLLHIYCPWLIFLFISRYFW